MIVLHAKVPVDPDRRDEAVDLVESLVEDSKEEDGTIEYRAATDIQEPNTIRFFEQYEDEDAMEAHIQSDHYHEFAVQLPELLAGEPDVMRFDVESAEQLDL